MKRVYRIKEEVIHEKPDITEPKAKVSQSIIFSCYESSFLPFFSMVLCLTGSTVDHRSLPPEFKSQCGHVWRVFHLWLRFITFGDHSAHLVCTKVAIKHDSSFYGSLVNNDNIGFLCVKYLQFIVSSRWISLCFVNGQAILQHVHKCL